MENRIKILLEENGKLPTLASSGSVAYDLYIPEDTVINKGRQVISLQFRLELPHQYEAKIEARSGFSLKGMQGYYPISGPYQSEHRYDADVLTGKIDSDYRGIVGVIIRSNEDKPFLLKEGTRIAQLSIYKVHTPGFEIVTELSETERGEGGFGHSGTK